MTFCQSLLHEAILCDLRIILKPFGGWHCKRKAVCADVLRSVLLRESRFYSFYNHFSNKTGFACVSAAFASSNFLV